VKSLAALVALCGLARAAGPPTVAVMPFKDLSGEKGSIGEAIRETVTSDLRDVPGLRVIERANLDQILDEQNLGAKKADLDPTSTARIGKLLGATLMVAGAYQKSGPSVRLTARFVKVETGEIVGTAKVDGPQRDFLDLQDRVTVELLKSAGIEAKHVQKFAKRARPKIKSLKTVELYGDSLVERDDDKKRDLLKLALDEDASFVYAARDLDALEKRLAAYDAAARAAGERKIRQQIDDTHAKLKAETDPQRIRDLYRELFSALEQGRRWRTLLVEARALKDHPPPPVVGAPAPPGKATFEEGAAYEVLYAEFMLKMHDAVLRDGENFLKQFPTSMVFPTVKSWLAGEIELKRKIEAGKPKAAAEYAALESRRRWDLCAPADIYQQNAQFIEAQRLYRACLAMGTRQRWSVLLRLVQVDVELADWAAARADLKDLGAEKWEHAASYRTAMESVIPADG